jgi:hypothetical protein
MHFLLWFKRELMAYGDKASEGSKIVETNCVLWQTSEQNEIEFKQIRKIVSYV